MNFHTIDPLILETLNLNEKRMNHILDILHGKPKNKAKQINQVKKKHYFENSLRQDAKNYSTLLPDITRRNQTLQASKVSKIKEKKYNTIIESQTKIKRRAFSLKQNKSNYSTHEKNIQYFKSNLRNTNNFNDKKERVDTIDQLVTPISLRNYQKHQKSSNNSLSAVRSKFATHKNPPLSSPSARDLSPRPNFNEDEVILEESLIGSISIKNNETKPTNKRFKTKQNINDYIGQIGLKKSKSMMLNPKDIYRMEIQKIVSQMIPIEKLQDAEKKMKRIKKRHQNLKHFDQKYFSRLNEMDLVLL